MVFQLEVETNIPMRIPHFRKIIWITVSYANMRWGFSEMDAWEALAQKSWIVMKENNIKVVFAVAEDAYVYELFHENNFNQTF